MPNFRPFLIAEIRKIDLETLFFRILKIHHRNLDLWVRIQFVPKKNFPGDNRFYRGQFLNLVTWQHFWLCKYQAHQLSLKWHIFQWKLRITGTQSPLPDGFFIS